MQFSPTVYFAADRIVFAFVPAGRQLQTPALRLLEPPPRSSTVLNTTIRAPYNALNSLMTPDLIGGTYGFRTGIQGVGDLKLAQLNASSDGIFPFVLNGELRDQSGRQYNVIIKCKLNDPRNLLIAEFTITAVKENCPALTIHNAPAVEACNVRNGARQGAATAASDFLAPKYVGTKLSPFQSSYR